MLPYITILYVVCGSLMLFIAALALQKKHRSVASIILALFAYAVCAWMISLYLGFFFAADQPNLSLWSIRFAHGFASLFFMLLPTFFYLFLGTYVKYSKVVIYIHVGVALSIAIVSVTTPFVYKEVIIENGLPVADVFGPIYAIFTAHMLWNYFLTFWIATKKIRIARGIDRIKLKIAAMGVGTFLFLALFTNGILPIFGVYILQLESPVFSLFFLIPAFYSIIKYRFLDIKFILTRAFKIILSLFLATVIASLFLLVLQFFSPNGPPFLLIFFDIACGVIVFLLCFKFLNSNTFHKIFGISDIEYFRETITKFRNKDASYRTISDFEKSLKESFHEKLGISFVRIVLCDWKNEKHYPALIERFEKSKEVLISKELQFMHGLKNEKIIFELKQLGEVCLPLLNPSRELLGFFVLGKKKFDDPYFTEEIEAIKQINFYLNLELTSILYKSQLKREVDQKTKKLKEMMQQQSDFIAVSAHELRTPLNIALLQMEDVEDFLKKSKKEKNFIRMHNALKRLELLTSQLFDIQKHDFNKVVLQLRDVAIIKFLSDIHADFLPLMRSKLIDFQFQSQLSSSAKIKIDPDQILQVIQNLLSNAIKFTPKKGKVILRVGGANNEIRICVSDSGKGVTDGMKRRVFEKFCSDHISQGHGIGLGLYICKKIIQLHKGKIWVQDVAGGGAEFCIQLFKKNKEARREEDEK